MLSQSARLVREQIRLQAEFGPLLLLGLDDERARAEVAARDRAIVRAVDRAPRRPRHAMPPASSCAGSPSTSSPPRRASNEEVRSMSRSRA